MNGRYALDSRKTRPSPNHHLTPFRRSHADRIGQKPTAGYRGGKQPLRSRPLAAIRGGSYPASDGDRQAFWEATLLSGVNLVFSRFGVIFALAAALIGASNFAVPKAQATGDLREIAVIGIVHYVIGCGIYLGATRVLKWYRRQLSSR